MAGHDLKSERDIVTLQTFGNDIDAELAKSALRARGIHCMLMRENCDGKLALGIRLMVRAEDADTAKELLSGNQSSE